MLADLPQGCEIGLERVSIETSVSLTAPTQSLNQEAIFVFDCSVRYFICSALQSREDVQGTSADTGEWQGLFVHRTGIQTPECYEYVHLVAKKANVKNKSRLGF